MLSLLTALMSPARAEPLTSEQLDAILTFRNEHLQLRQLDTFIPGSITVLRSGWGWGPRPWRGYGWGMGGTDVIASPPEMMYSWGVYQGPHRLAVPEYLDAVGRTDEYEDLAKKIRSNRDTATGFGVLGLAGVGAGITGVVGMLAGPERLDPAFTGLGLGGLGTAIISGIVSDATRTRAMRLHHNFPKTQDIQVVEEEVRAYNERLREDLGLTPAQAYRELDRRE